MSTNLYVDIPGMTDILGVSVATSHSASTATAQVETRVKTVNIGDQIEIDLGYEDNHTKVFQGYVKNIQRKVPEDTYIVIAKDDLVRATDFFIVPTNPEDSFKRTNISAERLVQEVLELAGLTNFTYTATSFTFATKSNNPVEVKLVSAYDFCKMIADLLAWHLWCDEDGLVHFENRKPYVMDGTSSQPGDIPDVAINAGSPIDDTVILDVIYNESEKDLRNRVVVHGSEGVYAEAKSSTSLNPITGNQEQILPSGYYKSMALVSSIIDSDSMAEKAVEYNLDLYNKLTVSISMAIIGRPDFLARKVIEINEESIGLTGDWYIFLAEHQWSRNGYVVNLELRK